jgi:hypothetical protein
MRNEETYALVAQGREGAVQGGGGGERPEDSHKKRRYESSCNPRKTECHGGGNSSPNPEALVLSLVPSRAANVTHTTRHPNIVQLAFPKAPFVPCCNCSRSRKGCGIICDEQRVRCEEKTELSESSQ